MSNNEWDNQDLSRYSLYSSGDKEFYILSKSHLKELVWLLRQAQDVIHNLHDMEEVNRMIVCWMSNREGYDIRWHQYSIDSKGKLSRLDDDES